MNDHKLNPLIDMSTRRNFFRSMIALSTGLGAFSWLSSAVASVQPLASSGNKIKFNLGIASYTFRQFDRAQVLQWAKQLEIKYICFKDFHLPLTADNEECAKVAEECRSYGVELIGCGTVTFKDAADIDNAFRYAEAAGMKHIVCTIKPTAKVEELLQYLDKKVKSSSVVAAIHNHGPGDQVFPTAKVAYEKIKHLDKRIGFCIDIGHTERLGESMFDDLKVCPERIYDIHFKDITKAAKEGVSEVPGRGVLDIRKLFETLIEIGYDRTLSIEYEENPNNPLPYVAETVGFARGMAHMF